MRATGGIFEIFQNGHIFLKFCFFNIKKKKVQALEPASGLVAAPYDPAWDGLPEGTEPARAC